jgi:NAD+ synthase (glutamine-hydrolysing)
MKIALAQLNPVVGDIRGNLARLIETMNQCKNEKPDLVVFPEMFITGYPPQDLLERGWFIKTAQDAVEEVMKISNGYPETGIIFGAPQMTGLDTGRGLYNAGLIVSRGRKIGMHCKALLPTYDVFDEARYFDPGQSSDPIPFKDEKLGLSICEDAWNSPELWLRSIYTRDPIAELAEKGATLMINIAASPFSMGKEEVRYKLIHSHCQKHGRPFVFVNQTGGNDELIFDGRSMCLDSSGGLITILPSFRESVTLVQTGQAGKPEGYEPCERISSVYDALVFGLSDYMRKCGFQKAVIGLSGGIDSALVAVIARDAIGASNVLGVTMPGPYSSKGSIEDSRKTANNLGVKFEIIPIMSVFDSYLKTLRDQFANTPMDAAEENIQARIRGNILMAISNKFGHMVLATGNKSEIAVGYCTLYGDMSGGLAVISDVPKTMIYRLAHHVNRQSRIIPREVIEKPPSAELRPNQKDQDTLPPYEVLDPILQHYIEEGKSADDIVRLGYDAKTVAWVVRAVHKSEYKRLQAAPGLKVTSKAFGTGRRMPVAARINP